MAPQDLPDLQRWFQSVITDPANFNPHDEEICRHILPSRALTAQARFEIYQQAYFARLLECLRNSFPVLVATLTPEVFDQFALGYLLQHPPESYTLNRLADRFVEYLRVTRPVEEPRGGWADLMIDIARLEQAIDEVFDGSGTEGMPPLDAQQLSAIPSDRLPGLRLIPSPSLRLLVFDFPLSDYFEGIRRGEAPSLPTAAPSWLVLCRVEYIVRRIVLDRSQFIVLESLVQGNSLGDSLAKLDSLPDSIAAEADVSRWFHSWNQARFFVAAM